MEAPARIRLEGNGLLGEVQARASLGLRAVRPPGPGKGPLWPTALCPALRKPKRGILAFTRTLSWATEWAETERAHLQERARSKLLRLEEARARLLALRG
ncbi:hypothetical protein TthSNM11_12100 [Thermus thermophilus]|mgnify:CR=1 FL=1|nr:hypothetical protein TthSNM11_12100 [Thermus thermophilus]BDG22526.1 hypothetical protein TthSNM17_21880 [Thermus thermophilus]BDG30251.1 hypothetical protein TthSNM76_24610 [Thermus thermophilus]